jgi:hypothetical protein
MLSLFGFGKRRKVKRKSSKAVRKPPARLLKICKKYHVKATKKVGGRRVYMSVAVLKRKCLKKARAMKKKMMKMMKKKMTKKKMMKHKKSSKTHRKKRTNRMDNDEEEEMSFGSRRRVPMFGRRSRFGVTIMGLGKTDNPVLLGKINNAPRDDRTEFPVNPTKKDYESAYEILGNVNAFRKDCTIRGGVSDLSCKTRLKFGKRRGSAKVSKAKAMKAFRSFWKRHCKGRGAGFGNGGNPMLSASMGYEFCPNGMGGVLGANSTGLFPSSCKSSSSFGKRRKTVARKSRMCSAIGSRRRRSAAGSRKRRSAIGSRRRRRSAIGSRKRRSAIGSRRRRRPAIGSRKRRSAIGMRRRRRSATGVRRKRRSAIGSRRRRSAIGMRRRRRYAA